MGIKWQTSSTVSRLDEELEGNFSVVDMNECVQGRELILNWSLQSKLNVFIDGVGNHQQILCVTACHKEHIVNVSSPNKKEGTSTADLIFYRYVIHVDNC